MTEAVVRRTTIRVVKRVTDISIAIIVLCALSPILLIVSSLVWLSDRQNPIYMAERMGAGERPFRMMKFRSMVVNAAESGVDSTAENDDRITSIGRLLRRYKIDELPQLWNVLVGDMSVVGPRPNVSRETIGYSDVERRLLSVAPGITDIASIVFADEGEILAGRSDPDLAYNQLIRPGKSRLGLFYLDHETMTMDLRILFLTALAVVNRRRALQGIGSLLTRYGAAEDLIELCRREKPLLPEPPPGFKEIVRHRVPLKDNDENSAD